MVLLDGTPSDLDRVTMVRVGRDCFDDTGLRIGHCFSLAGLCAIGHPNTAALERGLIVPDETACLGSILDRLIRQVAVLIQILALIVDLPGTAHGDMRRTGDGDAAAAALTLIDGCALLRGDIGIGSIISADDTAGNDTLRILTGKIYAATIAFVGDIAIDMTTGDLQLRVLSAGHIDTTAIASGIIGTGCDRRIHRILQISRLIAVDLTVIDQDVFEEAVHLGLISLVLIGLRVEVDTAAMLGRGVFIYLRAVESDRDGIIKGTAVFDRFSGIGLESDAAAVGRRISVDQRGGIKDQRTVLSFLHHAHAVVVDLLGDTAATPVSMVVPNDTVGDRHVGLIENAGPLYDSVIAFDEGILYRQMTLIESRGVGLQMRICDRVPIDATSGAMTEIAPEDTVIDGRHRRGLADGTEGTRAIVFIVYWSTGGGIRPDREKAVLIEQTARQIKLSHDAGARVERGTFIVGLALVEPDILQRHPLIDRREMTDE